MNVVFWNFMPCGSCKNRRFEGKYCLHPHGDRMLRLLLAANVRSSLILVTLMIEALGSSETLVLTRATRRNVLEDGILHKIRLYTGKNIPTSGQIGTRNWGLNCRPGTAVAINLRRSTNQAAI
jgi:hypothetical protein